VGNHPRSGVEGDCPDFNQLVGQSPCPTDGHQRPKLAPAGDGAAQTAAGDRIGQTGTTAGRNRSTRRVSNCPHDWAPPSFRDVSGNAVRVGTSPASHADQVRKPCSLLRPHPRDASAAEVGQPPIRTCPERTVGPSAAAFELPESTEPGADPGELSWPAPEIPARPGLPVRSPALTLAVTPRSGLSRHPTARLSM
jgi:hypothetical protein